MNLTQNVKAGTKECLLRQVEVKKKKQVILGENEIEKATKKFVETLHYRKLFDSDEC
jgi:hypothetical protein